MAAKLFCKFLFILLLFGASHGAVSNRTAFSASSSQGCTCDLTGNSCDTNCCCDPDCTASEKEAFTKCKDAEVNEDNKVCVSNNLLFIQNTNFKTQATGTGLFCIFRDNYSSRNYYNDITSASSDTEFNDLKKQSSKSIYIYQSLQQAKPSASFYKAGDPIILVFDSGAQGFLSLPKPLISKECDDENPAGYLNEASTDCTRTITDLPSQCSSLPFLAAKSYYKNFKVAKNPSIYYVNTTNAAVTTNVGSNVTKPVTTWLLNTTLLLDISITQPILCKTDLGVSNKCSFSEPPNPVYDAVKKTCSNVVLEVEYTLQWNTSTDLTQVGLRLVLGQLSSNNKLPILQKFSVKYKKEGSDAFSRSGNPGYIAGKPLVAGTLKTDPASKAEYISLSIDPLSWLTIAGPSSDGSCHNSTDRFPVVFGVDVRTGCNIRLSLSTSSSSCQVLQDTALNVLLAGVPSHVATFGNSDVNKPGDWVKIINNKPTQTVSGGNGVCSNMIMGLHIEVLYSNFGFLANPQPKVVGVQFKYEDPKDIKYQCVGPYCQLGSKSVTQSFEVVTSVQFIDVSTTPETLLKPTPTFEAKAPSDFFYPFL